jgi:hypothetical protein
VVQFGDVALADDVGAEHAVAAQEAGNGGNIRQLLGRLLTGVVAVGQVDQQAHRSVGVRTVIHLTPHRSEFYRYECNSFW